MIFFFFNGWKVIPDELLQHRHSYFIVLTALLLIVPIKRRCQCYFFSVLVVCVPLHSSGAHQFFLKWCKGYAWNITSVKYAAAKLIPLWSTCESWNDTNNISKPSFYIYTQFSPEKPLEHLAAVQILMAVDLGYKRSVMLCSILSQHYLFPISHNCQHWFFLTMTTITP